MMDWIVILGNCFLTDATNVVLTTKTIGKLKDFSNNTIFHAKLNEDFSCIFLCLLYRLCYTTPWSENILKKYSPYLLYIGIFNLSVKLFEDIDWELPIFQKIAEKSGINVSLAVLSELERRLLMVLQWDVLLEPDNDELESCRALQKILIAMQLKNCTEEILEKYIATKLTLKEKIFLPQFRKLSFHDKKYFIIELLKQCIMQTENNYQCKKNTRVFPSVWKEAALFFSQDSKNAAKLTRAVSFPILPSSIPAKTIIVNGSESDQENDSAATTIIAHERNALR